MATGNIGRLGVGVNPLRGQNNVQGACDMGSFPHELSGYRHISERCDPPHVRGAVGRAARQRARPAHPEHAGCRRRRHLQGPLRPGRGHPAVRSRTPSMSPPVSRRWNASWCRTSSSTRRPITPTSSCPARPFSRRTAPSPTPSGASSACARSWRRATDYADWEITLAVANAMGFGMTYTHPSEIMDEIARADADLRRRLLPEARRARLGAMALQREGARRHAGHAYERLRARQGQVRRDRIRPDRRAHRAAVPAAADHRPHPQPVQCRRADAPHRQRRLARGGSCWRSIRTMPSSAASATATG